jgi:predicted metal-binding membrane protein
MQPLSSLETILRRDRIIVAVALVTVIGACWLYLLSGAGMDMSMSFPRWTPGYALLVFVMWWLMMIAMMLPSAAPMVLLHATVTRNGLTPDHGAEPATHSRQLVLASTAFITGYLVMWGAFSLVAVIVQWMLQSEGLLSPMMTTTSPLFGAGLLFAAGLWQLTPIKTACLRQCQSPVSFISRHWRAGVYGAFGMGIKHGGYCLGCCWFLMALLFFGGVMNLIWIAGLALIVLIEKLTPRGELVGKIIGVLLIAWGAWLAATAT